MTVQVVNTISILICFTGGDASADNDENHLNYGLFTKIVIFQ